MLEAGFIREIFHPEWLANLVIFPTANGKLRMCMDYTDLNKAYPVGVLLATHRGVYPRW
jgi:hypothetical protein